MNLYPQLNQFYMSQPLNIHEFIALHFRYACHWNPSCEYSAFELEGARRIIEADMKHFNPSDKDFLIQSFACLLRSIIATKASFEEWDEGGFQRKGESWKLYHEMIPEFNRAMQCFYYGSKSQLEHGEKTFPITEVVFKGDLKDERIVLSGPVLGILKAMFDSFNRTMWDSQQVAMREYSFELYEKFQEFMMQWQILNADKGTLAKQLIKNREEESKETALNRYKYNIAYNVHLALKGLALRKTSASYPSLHKRIIGKLLQEVGLFNYLGYTTDKDIENFIKRGESLLH